jgi:DNA segregation ATPase FtsK/SpoIIIE, S-DNA-T family
MLVEVTTSILAGGLIATTKYFKSGGSSDHAKIQSIAKHCGLVSREGKEMRILRSNRGREFNEYVYSLPEGLSSNQFREKLDHFQDGLNANKAPIDISLADIRQLNLRSNPLRQIRSLFEAKSKRKKEVEIDYDGTIKFRVYNEPMPKLINYDINVAKKCSGWEVPVGYSRNGLVKHDFEKKAHIIVAGTTDFGKSNWVNTTINTLLTNKPDDVSFVLIDLKGGLEFNRYRQLKQVKAYATDPAETREALQSAVDEMDRITAELLSKGHSNVKDAGSRKRLFIVIDEAADLADDKECQELLKDIARKGRASGLRLVYTTQYPTAETVSSQVKRNCVGRLCFVLDTAIASQVVLDQKGAESLPAIQGRALYKDLKLTEVQTTYISADTMANNIKINIRKGPSDYERRAQKGTTDRRHTLELEETRLS